LIVLKFGTGGELCFPPVSTFALTSPVTDAGFLIRPPINPRAPSIAQALSRDGWEAYTLFKGQINKGASWKKFCNRARLQSGHKSKKIKGRALASEEICGGR
jgi:hypothetical protein